MRKILIIPLALTAAIAVLVSSASASSASACSTPWGSLPENSGDLGAGHVTGVRAGRHACFDRLVVDLDAPGVGYRVSYVDQVTQDGSGQPVPLAGGADLQVVVLGPAYDDNGNSTFRPANPAQVVNVGGFRTFRQVAYAGSFEGQTTFGLGVRARLPFRVFVLAGPGSGSRIVIDVAHVW